MKRVSLALVMVAIVFISGCYEDQAYYRGSKYKQLDIAKLVDIPSGGYMIESTGELGSGRYGELVLHFCKNNRYIYFDAVSDDPKKREPHRGNYRVDMAHETIVFISDKTDSNGKHLQGIIDTGNGYIEQKERLEIKGMDVVFYKIDQINPSDCIKLTRD